jgi:hypothetical protein
MQALFTSTAAFIAVLSSFLVGFFLGDRTGEERVWDKAQRSGWVEYNRTTGERQLVPPRSPRPRPMAETFKGVDPPGGGAWLQQPLGSDK